MQFNPPSLLKSLGRLGHQLAAELQPIWYCYRLRRAQVPTNKLAIVSYAHADFPQAPPSTGVVQAGGAIKYQHLSQRRPHAGLDCHILYAVSSSHYSYTRMEALVRHAQAEGIKLVWNQDGAYFPHAYGAEKSDQRNGLMSLLLHRANYVFYQSKFSQFASDYFLGKRMGAAEVLYNAVDTQFFRPIERLRSAQALTLLIVGTHEEPYRLPTAIKTLAEVRKYQPHTRLLIAGRRLGNAQAVLDQLIAEYGLAEWVDFTGPYTQKDAPSIFQQGDILLHTKYNDPCPSAVIEAMACGLPVVYSNSGGTPELVGAEAGYGVPATLNWLEAQPPDPQVLAKGVLEVAEAHTCYSKAARERAVTNFDLQPWLIRHFQIFDQLMEQ